MLKGGYRIIDLKGNNLEPDVAATVETVIIPGIHDAIEGSHGKPLMLSGIVIDGVEKNDQYIVFTVSSGTYTAPIEGGTLTITSDDEVSIVKPNPEPDPGT